MEKLVRESFVELEIEVYETIKHDEKDRDGNDVYYIDCSYTKTDSRRFEREKSIDIELKSKLNLKPGKYLVRATEGSIFKGVNKVGDRQYPQNDYFYTVIKAEALKPELGKK